MSGPGRAVSGWAHDLLAVCLILATHLPTMYPGLMGSGDTAKFQYVGRVLGTPHNPGYPFYVLVSYAFSFVPVGSLAFRANLLSVVAATVAVVLMRRLLRRLDCAPFTALCGALAFGWGLTFWELALRAEVYTVAAALLTATLLLLVRWRDSRRDRELLGAVAMVALALGHHLTIVTCVPAFVAFVVLTDARSALRWRVLPAAFLLVALGLAQYGFIVLRTWQQAPYLESQARSLGELLDVVRGRQFASLMLAAEATTAERVSALAHAVARELGVVPILALLPGLVVTARRRWPDLVLWLGSASGALAFVTVYAVPDFSGFLVPVFVSLWPIAATGMETAATWLRGRAPAGAVLASILVLAAPCSSLALNYRANDHSRRDYEINYFDALFRMLPDRAVLLGEDYAIDQMVNYKLLGERAGGSRDIIALSGRDPVRIRELVQQGYRVFAFAQAEEELREKGFRFAPVTLNAGGAAGGTPIAMQHIPLYRLTSADDCIALGNAGWTDVTQVAASGQGRVRLRLDNYRPFDSRLSLVTIGGDGTAPRLVAFTGATSVDVRTVRGAGDPDGPPAETRTWSVSDTVWRTDARVNDLGAWALLLVDLGTPSARALARVSVDLDNPRRATLCAEGRDLAPPISADGTMTIPFGAQGNAFFGRGWHAAESRPDGAFRWTSAKDAQLVLLRETDHAALVRVEARSLPPPPGVEATVGLVVNGVPQGDRPVSTHWTSHTWRVSGPWRAGFNEIVITASSVARPRDVGLGADDRTLGVAISDLRLSQAGPR